MTDQPSDFRQLPADVPAEERVAVQLGQQPFGGPEGGGGAITGVDGVGDGD